MDLLLLALLLALTVWSARRLRRAWLRRRLRQVLSTTPGRTPDNPIVLTHARQMSEALATVRCPCGGAVQPLGETPRLGLRVARGRCVECEADVDLYFVMPQYVN